MIMIFITTMIMIIMMFGAPFQSLPLIKTVSRCPEVLEGKRRASQKPCLSK